MPQYRKLHTKIIDSYDFAEMPNDFTRVFWMLLIVALDSEGRAIDNPAWLRSKMYPLRDDVSAKEIDDAINWLEVRKMVKRYQVNGRGYFYVPNFKKYQTGTEKEAKSVLPAPPITPEEVLNYSEQSQEQVSVDASASAYESVSEYAYESVDGETNEFDKMRRTCERLTGLPANGKAAIDAINELVSSGCTEEDIRAGIAWTVAHGRQIKHLDKLVGPSKVEMQKRVQKEQDEKPLPSRGEKVMMILPNGETVEAQS